MSNNSHNKDREIYEKILADVKELLTKLPQKASNPELAKAMVQLEEIVSPAYKELDQSIQSLQKHANWDTFTIAFYGETNAGKSTTIETLRIVLGEETKKQSRLKFCEIQEKNGLTTSSLTSLQTQIADGKDELQKLSTQIEFQRLNFVTEENRQNARIHQLREDIAARKVSASLFQRFLNFFRKLPEETFLQKEAKILADMMATQKIKLTQWDNELHQSQNTLQKKQTEFNRSIESLKKLETLSDGLIVGTGLPDKTIETTPYDFQADGKSFRLLDVPGIEGKETKVMDSILSAVESAHAVFYVTGKAAAPQTGEPGSPGTLEKIRQHLGDQAEVWSIFNKRITNPIQLDQPDLLTHDEKESLKVLDETMRKHLGEQYRGCISISALPAFLSHADCLVPMSALDGNRAKFLRKMSAQDVLTRSGFASFVSWLTKNMASDIEGRMRTSNFKKISLKVQNIANTLLGMQHDELEPLCEAIQADWAKVRAQLETEVGMFVQSINAIGTSEILNIESTLRKTMYDRIDNGIDNKEVQPLFEQALRTESKSLEQRVQTIMKEKLNDFSTSVSERLERFTKRVDELQSLNRRVDSLSFNNKSTFNFKFSNGLNYLGLASSLIGGVLMFWNPAGWVLLGIGAVTAVVGIAKAVWGFFDGDFKKSEQRKAVTENLRKLHESLTNEFNKSSSAISKEMTVKINQILLEVEDSVDETKIISSELKRVAVKLQQLSSSIT